MTVVQDGAEALAALGRQMFDVVLMDIQMPHMDGLETTQAIRAREQDIMTRVPIVAMTAHAMQGDRERCLAAGMDGYVAKPLRPKELFEVIARLTAPAASTPETPTAAEEEQDILDGKTLWERVAGDADLLREIIELFLADCPERLLELHEALSTSGLPISGAGRASTQGRPGEYQRQPCPGGSTACGNLPHRAGDVQAATEALARLENELAHLTPLLAVYAGDGPAAVTSTPLA